MARKVIELNEKQIITDYKENRMTQNEIASKYDVNVTYIRRILRKNDIDTRMNSKTASEIDEKIYEQILLYKKISEISTELNVSRDVVRRVADNHGIDIVQYRNNHFEDEVARLIQEGQTYIQIMNTLPVSMDFIKKTIEKKEIDTPMVSKEKQVLDLYNSQNGIVKISKELKMSTRTIHKILSKNGLE